MEGAVNSTDVTLFFSEIVLKSKLLNILCYVTLKMQIVYIGIHLGGVDGVWGFEKYNF